MREGWEVRAFGEVCVFENGDRGKNYPGRKAFVPTGVPFINAGHIADGKIDWEGMNYIPEAHFERISRGKISQGDLLFCLRGSLGKFGHVTQPMQGAIASSLVIIRSKLDISVEFLKYFLRSESCDEQIEKYAGGAAQPNLSATDLKKFKIPLPPLAEQKRIVALLDEAFAGIAVATAAATKNLKNARELFETTLNTTFTQKGEGWVVRKLGDATLLQIIDGDRGANYPKKTDFLDEGFCLFLNTKNVRPDGFRFDTTMFINEEKDQALRKGKLERRDVLLTTRGTIGNIALYDEAVPFDNIRINSGMLIFRPNEKAILADYLFELLRSSFFKSQVTAFVSGAAQPQLPIKTLVNFDLPVPKSLEKQKEIVEMLLAVWTQTQRLEALYQQKIVALNELKQSLLQKAFAGELTAGPEILEATG